MTILTTAQLERMHGEIERVAKTVRDAAGEEYVPPTPEEKAAAFRRYQESQDRSDAYEER